MVLYTLLNHVKQKFLAAPRGERQWPTFPRFYAIVEIITLVYIFNSDIQIHTHLYQNNFADLMFYFK